MSHRFKYFKTVFQVLRRLKKGKDYQNEWIFKRLNCDMLSRSYLRGNVTLAALKWYQSSGIFYEQMWELFLKYHNPLYCTHIELYIFHL